MKRAMALATRVECDKESDGFAGKSDGNKGGRQLTATRAMAMVMATTWVMATVTRLAGDKEGKGEGGKGDDDGDEGGGRQRGNGDGGNRDGDGNNGGRWRWDDGGGDKGGRGWRATKRAMAMVARAMVMTTRLEGK